MLFIGLQLTVCPDHSERKSTRIYANREPMHPRLAPLIAGRGRLAWGGEGLNGISACVLGGERRPRRLRIENLLLRGR